MTSVAVRFRTIGRLGVVPAHVVDKLVDRVLIEGWSAATAAEMLGVSRATAYKWLRSHRVEGRAGLEDRSACRRHGLSRLAHADRPTGAPVRYVRERPGELIHVDVKCLGRVPPGGGHRLLGESARNHLPVRYDYLHVAIDDASRVAYVAVRPGLDGQTPLSVLVNKGEENDA